MLLIPSYWACQRPVLWGLFDVENTWGFWTEFYPSFHHFCSESDIDTSKQAWAPENLGFNLYLKWWGSSWQLTDKIILRLGCTLAPFPKGQEGLRVNRETPHRRPSFILWLNHSVPKVSLGAQANAILEGSWGLPRQLGKAALSISAAQVFPFEGREVTELFRNSMCIHLNASLPALMCWGDQTGIAGYNWELIKAALLQTFCGSFHSSLIKNKREEESFTAMSHLRYNGRNSKRLMRQNKADIMKAMSTH